MLHIILLILKILGILLLSIIGLAFILILMVLFIPVRYNVKAFKYDDIHMNLVVSWFLHCITYKQMYNGSKMISKIRIFGFVIKDSEKPKTKKIRKAKKIKKATKKNKKKHESDVKIAEIPNSKAAEVTKSIIAAESLQVEESEATSKKKRFIDKLRSFLRKMKEILSKIPVFFITIKTTYLNIIEMKNTIIRRISSIREFLKKEENKLGFKKIWWAIKKFTKHIWPKKLKFNIHFGTGDPCSTGQLLGVIGMTYHLYQKSVTIIPDFTEEVYEGDIFAKGRIRVITILVISIRVLLDKNFKQLLKGFNELKEEL